MTSTETEPETIPERYRKARYHIIDNAMPPEFIRSTSRWLHENRKRFQLGLSPSGVGEDIGRANHELIDVDDYCEGMSDLRKRVVEGLPEACAGNGIPEFDLQYIEMHATLYHHFCHFAWHDDAPDYSGQFVPTRRLAYSLYMHTDPKMFNGGQLEFVGGQKVEPDNNRLVFFHPLQQHRVRLVECWSRNFLHGRWAIFGWIHGPAPEGAKAPELRGKPRSG